MLTISIRVTISVIEIDCSICSKQLRSSNEMFIISFKDSYALQFNLIALYGSIENIHPIYEPLSVVQRTA